ncbi:MAG: DNA cytosine methyltransferase [Bacteroidaceae bacterium]|nr:DNA cytosine methyltransferase [Bacteroidaceae bacterium]
MIRVLELFAGIGACSKALTNLGIEHEIVDAVEIDKYAIKSFNAIHGTNFEPQDITKWDKSIKADLIMHGSPCQDFSVAGRQAGGDEGSGTRSSLLYETLRIVAKVQPDIVIWENVKNLLSKRHKHNHEAYIQRMSDMGYDSATQILNAKDYGIPQNRERVFTLSIKRGSKLVKSYTRPEPRPLELKLKDILEDEVDEKYYLTDEQVASFVASTERAKAKGNGFKFEPIERERESNAQRDDSGRATPDRQLHQGIIGRIEAIKGHDQIKRVYGEDGMSPTISTMQGGNREPKIAIRTANKKGYDMATDGDGIDLGYPNSTTRRGRVGHGVSKTIPTGGGDSMGTLDGIRIRKLTPRECWRLMGFDDADFDKAQAAGISNTQLYKQAGNSIVVNCLEAIFNGIEWSNDE